MVARRLERQIPGIRAVAAKQVKRYTEKGVTQLKESILFPGYVFFETSDEAFSPVGFFGDGIIRALTTVGGDWRLSGLDERFAQWLFSYDGVIKLSTAYQQGDKVRIIAGPLKDMEGQIIRIDRRNKSGQVALVFNNMVIKAWLGFEWVERQNAGPSAVPYSG